MEGIMKKRGRFIAGLIAIILVLASMSALLVACSDSQDDVVDEVAEYSVTDAINELGVVFANTYMNDGKGFGWDADIYLGDIRLQSVGNINPADTTKTAFDFDISQNGNDIIDISADDKNLYVVSGDFERTFRDFALGEVVHDAAMPISDSGKDGGFDDGDIISYIQAGLTGIFGDGASVTKGAPNKIDGSYKLVLEGDLSGVVGMLQGMVPSELSSILDMLAGVTVKLQATINNTNNKLVGIKIDLAGINVNIKKLELGQDLKDNVTVELPIRRQFFETTNLLNFTLKGKFEMSNSSYSIKDDKITVNPSAPVYTMHYEVRVDMNIFKALRDGFMANGSFDARAIFADDTNKIFINLLHDCDVDDHGSNYCPMHKNFQIKSKPKAGKGEGAQNQDPQYYKTKGSVLTIAYDPTNFGNHKVYVSLDGRSLLPTDLINKAMGMLPKLVALAVKPVIWNIFAQDAHLAIALDPVALLTNSVAPNAGKESSEKTEGEDIPQTLALTDDPSNPMNILDMIVKAIRLVGSVDFENYAVSIGTPELMNVLKSAVGEDIAGIISPLFADTQSISLSVESAMFSDPSTCGLDLKESYRRVHPNKVENGYKKFTFNGNDISPIQGQREYVKKGDVIQITNGGLKNVNDNGELQTLTAQQVKNLFNGGEVQYTATDINGTKHSDLMTAKIVGVYGIDYTKVGVPQNITVVTNDSSQGGMGIFSQIAHGGLGKIIDLAKDVIDIVGIIDSIPGDVFNTTITISESKVKTKAFKVDFSKTKYHYGSVVDPSVKVTEEITATGELVEHTILPDNYNQYFDEGNKIKVFEDFELVYTFGGKEISRKKVTMDDTTFTGMTNNKEVKVGQNLNTSDGVQIASQKDPSAELGVYHMSGSDRITKVAIEKDGKPYEFAKVTIHSNGIVTLNFPEEGKYNVTISVDGEKVDFDMHYVITVK